MQTPDTPTQAKAREEYVEAARQLAAAAVALQEAQAAHDEAMARYHVTYGAARQAGVA